MLGQGEAVERDMQLSQRLHRATGARKWGLVGIKMGYDQSHPGEPKLRLGKWCSSFREPLTMLGKLSA